MYDPVAAQSALPTENAAGTLAALVSSGMELQQVIFDPVAFGMRSHAWLALNAPAELVTSHPEHTLAGVLRVQLANLKALASQ